MQLKLHTCNFLYNIGSHLFPLPPAAANLCFFRTEIDSKQKECPSIHDVKLPDIVCPVSRIPSPHSHRVDSCKAFRLKGGKNYRKTLLHKKNLILLTGHFSICKTQVSKTRSRYLSRTKQEHNYK